MPSSGHRFKATAMGLRHLAQRCATTFPSLKNGGIGKFATAFFEVLLLAVSPICFAADSAPVPWVVNPLLRHVDRSPVDLTMSPDARWLVTANQTSDSISLIEIATGKVVDELVCGSHPVDLDFTPDGKQILVTAKWSGTLHVFSIVDDRLHELAPIKLGADPHGIAISSDGSKAYVGLVSTSQVAQIDLATHRVTRHFDVGQWPKYLTVSLDGKRLAVGNGGDSNVMIVNTETGEQLYDERLSNGINLGQMRTSSDGKYAYFTWMVYRTNPLNIGNIQRGCSNGQRIAEITGGKHSVCSCL